MDAMMRAMTDWQQKIEAQIEDLREEAINYGGGRAYGQHLDDTADTMQALLDVAVAADSGHYDECGKVSCSICDALDKLREVGDE